VSSSGHTSKEAKLVCIISLTAKSFLYVFSSLFTDLFFFFWESYTISMIACWYAKTETLMFTVNNCDMVVWRQTDYLQLLIKLYYMRYMCRLGFHCNLPGNCCWGGMPPGSGKSGTAIASQYRKYLSKCPNQPMTSTRWHLAGKHNWIKVCVIKLHRPC